ncbi:MAG: hypothetical protein ABSF50_08910 [Burkholderiaceae bacterium]|jgi:hypothetical protein
MKHSTREQIDKIFELNAEKKRQDQKAKAEKELREAAFLLEFIECGEFIIKPAMEAIGEYARAKGLESRIESTEMGNGTSWNAVSPEYSIRFILGENQFGPEYQQPYVRIVCDLHSQKANFHESTIGPGRGGHSGQTGSVPLDEVTEDLVHSRILRVLAEILQ